MDEESNSRHYTIQAGVRRVSQALEPGDTAEVVVPPGQSVEFIASGRVTIDGEAVQPNVVLCRSVLDEDTRLLLSALDHCTIEAMSIDPPGTNKEPHD